MKHISIFPAIVGAIFALSADAAHAQKYDSRVANPFIFCKAPKPCKLCQPWRAIYEDICANQAEASKEESPNPAPPVDTPAPPEKEKDSTAEK